MKAETEETTWVLDIAGKTSVQVPVKEIKDKSTVQEAVIEYGK
jgi:hypothetical protein